MKTQTTDNESAMNSPSLFVTLKASMIGIFLLIGGFVISSFLFLLSAIMLPFAAFKVWTWQKQFQQYGNTSIIEGEYTVTENASDHS